MGKFLVDPERHIEKGVAPYRMALPWDRVVMTYGRRKSFVTLLMTYIVSFIAFAFFMFAPTMSWLEVQQVLADHYLAYVVGTGFLGVLSTLLVSTLWNTPLFSNSLVSDDRNVAYMAEKFGATELVEKVVLKSQNEDLFSLAMQEMGKTWEMAERIGGDIQKETHKTLLGMLDKPVSRNVSKVNSQIHKIYTSVRKLEMAHEEKLRIEELGASTYTFEIAAELIQKVEEETSIQTEINEIARKIILEENGESEQLAIEDKALTQKAPVKARMANPFIRSRR